MSKSSVDCKSDDELEIEYEGEIVITEDVDNTLTDPSIVRPLAQPARQIVKKKDSIFDNSENKNRGYTFIYDRITKLVEFKQEIKDGKCEVCLPFEVLFFMSITVHPIFGKYKLYAYNLQRKKHYLGESDYTGYTDVKNIDSKIKDVFSVLYKDKLALCNKSKETCLWSIYKLILEYEDVERVTKVIDYLLTKRTQYDDFQDIVVKDGKIYMNISLAHGNCITEKNGHVHFRWTQHHKICRAFE